jgi:Holliday junction resolvase-like predicted endonuclease
MTTLISLVGEQATPLLLPMLYLQPERLLLVTTKRTRPIAERVAAMFPHVDVSEDIPAYDIPKIYAALTEIVKVAKEETDEILFNLTGGTKPMALAAHQLTRERGAGWLYLQSQGAQSLLYRYRPEREEQPYTVERVSALLTLDLVLRAHLGKYGEKEPQDPAEELIVRALAARIDEYKTSVTHGGALEIDLVLRCGNQVGIVEVKTGKSARKKAGIDQLNTAAEQRYLGTYTRKYLILDRKMGSNNRELAEAHRIQIIVLPGLQKGKISSKERQTLLNAVLPPLGCKTS